MLSFSSLGPSIRRTAHDTIKIREVHDHRRSLVKQGELGEAEKIISRAESASRAPIDAKGASAERMRKSLQKAYANMSARRALQRARDKANGAHKDAQDVERGK